MTRNMYTEQENTGRDMCFVWSIASICVNTRDKLNAFFHVLLYLDQYIWSFLLCFFPPQDYAIKAEIDLELLPFIFGGPK